METNQVPKIEASKDFPVPVEKLYNAWTDGEQLKQWWKPMGNQLNDVTSDLHVGGTVRYTFSDNTLIISGEYEEVKENQRLVYTWNWEFPENEVKNAAYKLIVDFTNKDNGSTIHITQEDIQAKETVHPNEDGWEKGLNDLQQFLSGSGSDANNEQQKKSEVDPGETGYREMPEQQKVAGG